ncbi:L-seryl-tRNA(Sec) selenium transferase, partial [bacterium]|nr:L-seryl-tRNA(Sec) selenium transferase [bacterium]
ASADELAARARSIARRLRRTAPPAVRLTLTSGISQVGGGAYPLLELPTTLMAVEADGISPQEMEVRFRGMEVPVTGRIHKGRFLLDIRTLQDDDVPFIAAALRCLAG